MGVFKVNCVLTISVNIVQLFIKNAAFTENSFNYACVCATAKGVRITHLPSSIIIMKHNG